MSISIILSLKATGGVHCGRVISEISILLNIMNTSLHLGRVDSTALRPYCGCALGLLYMLKQLFSSSLMEVMKPGCPGNVESGETSLS